MGISLHSSRITMPVCARPYPTILEFLTDKFSQIPGNVWEQRIKTGKVLDDNSRPITADTEYSPHKRIFYFREVQNEPAIPGTVEIIFQDNELLVVCKPHFLPVTPGGRFVDECLLNRLRKSTGINDLAPLHRIDRETAGIVMFSVNKKSCAKYSDLFKKGLIDKTYQAVSGSIPEPGKTGWAIENRLEKGTPWFRMKTSSGTANTKSTIMLLDTTKDRALFQLHPITGKTHQLRIHMCSIGFGILNDNLYPQLQPEHVDDYEAPLQLLARTLRFKDPLTGESREFVSQRKLLWPG